MKKEIQQLAEKAKAASYNLATLTTKQKDAVLKAWAKALKDDQQKILRANAKDVKAAEEKGLKASLIDRLVLTEERIADMIQGVLEVAELSDPVGDIIEKSKRNGLEIQRVRIPLGVICMIYESRPNVTVDAAALCFKSGNAVILRGGSEAFHSNQALVKILRAVLKDKEVSQDVVTMIPYTDRTAMKVILSFDDLIDIAIPRGGEKLMQFMNEHSKVPVIKHDKGVCSLFVDASAKVKESIDVILNAKTQRPGVCNALETLYVHTKIAQKFLPRALDALDDAGVEVRGDLPTRSFHPKAKRASSKDWGEEYLDQVLAVRVVKDIDEAISCVREFSSHHTDGILTESVKNADLYVRSLDSSCVTVNTSTRFNDGGQLGLGAEIGISTTKLQAYGPMGLKELTTSRFLVKSDYKTRK